MGREIAVTELVLAFSLVVVSIGEAVIVDGLDVWLLVVPQRVAQLTDIAHVRILEVLLEALFHQMREKAKIRTRKTY